MRGRFVDNAPPRVYRGPVEYEIPAKKKILIVEHSEALGEALCDYLNERDYETFWGRDGLEGYALFLKEQPDLVILDALAPTLDGVALCEKIKDTPFGRRTKVIVTGRVLRNRKERESEDRHLSADEVLAKPFRLEELESKIVVQLNGTEGRTFH